MKLLTFLMTLVILLIALQHTTETKDPFHICIVDGILLAATVLLLLIQIKLNSKK